MVELEELRQQLHEEREARKEAERMLVACDVDLSSCAQQVHELALSPELSPHPIFMFSADGDLLLANSAAKKAFAEHFEDRVSLGTLFPEIYELNLRRIIKRDLTVSLKLAYSSSWFQAHIRGVSASNFINIYLSDITPIERIKNEVEEDRLETEQLIASIRSILVGLDNDGYITRWNSTAETVFGWGAQEAIGRHVDQCITAWSLGTFEVVQELMDGERHVGIADARYTRPDQPNERHIDIAITRVYNLDHHPAGYLILARDVTEKKELEIQLLQAQKLESLGQLAAGIAHEINTPIQFIGDNTHFLSKAFDRLDHVLEISERVAKQYAEFDAIPGLVEEMEQAMKTSKIAYMRNEIPYAIEETLKGLEQVASIVRGMKQFSHPGSGGKQLIDINECILDTITVSRNEWKYVAKMETDLDPALPPVMCYANEINQVMLNMVVNAAHAIEKSIKDGTQQQGKISLRTKAQAKGVCIEISDTGTGIPAEVLPKIFDPFFTTKEPGKGTGQGLSIVHNAIRKHDGIINVDTREGEGTTFTIKLPPHDPDMDE